MCGIFGFHLRHPVRADWQTLIERLGRISESRGKEACGLAARTETALSVLRWNRPLSHLLRQPMYKEFTGSIGTGKHDLAMIGHTRLVTNGDRRVMTNNQPVARDGIVLIHNGIICNYANLWRSELGQHPPSELDSEVLAALLARSLRSGKTPEEAVQELFGKIEGDASLAVLFEDRKQLVLATNTGSLYYSQSADGSLVFASQHSFLHLLQKEYMEFATIEQLLPRTVRVVELQQSNEPAATLLFPKPRVKRALKRCSKCILPETFPGISFDAQGVCNVCREHKHFHVKGRDALAALCDKYRRSDGRPDCLLAFSGGRDSSYALHYLVKELGMHPVTYTYDWGMVTDLARRNIARMCGKLGVENILVSADIPKKREYIRLNVEAWLKKPELGMVPLFMAGDKQFFYYQRQIAQELNLGLTFHASNQMEQTGFKSGFCGVKEATNNWYFNVSVMQKTRMLRYFLMQYLTNPSYLNRSLVDTLFSFYSAYVVPKDYDMFFNYIPWDEQVIMSTLKAEYSWETESAKGTTWRIGDGTAAFYNYIYHTMAGFTEHDTFRSTQIRQGELTREEALANIDNDNAPRFEAMQQYANLVGFDLQQAIELIERAPRLYDA